MNVRGMFGCECMLSLTDDVIVQVWKCLDG